MALSQIKAAVDSLSTLVVDPASNRLFWMSTGRTATYGRGSIGFMGALYALPWVPGLTFMQGGYTPLEFLQFNVTASTSYWSVGTKVQFFPSVGLFQGIAAGADFGFYPQNSGIPANGQVQAYYIAASFGAGPVETHVNAMQVVQGRSYSNGTFPTYVQFGAALRLSQASRGGEKLIAELWYANDYYQRHLELGFVLVGMRIYRHSFVGEIAFLMSPRFFLGGHGSSSVDLESGPYPYLSLMWYI